MGGGVGAHKLRMNQTPKRYMSRLPGPERFVKLVSLKGNWAGLPIRKPR